MDPNEKLIVLGLILMGGLMGTIVGVLIVFIHP